MASLAHNELKVVPGIHLWSIGTWAPFKYPIRHLTVRSLEVSKPWDWQFKSLHCFEIWKKPWQHCCQSAYQILEWLDNYKYKSYGFRDFTRSYDKTSYRILKQGLGCSEYLWTGPPLDQILPHESQANINCWLLSIEPFPWIKAFLLFLFYQNTKQFLKETFFCRNQKKKKMNTVIKSDVHPPVFKCKCRQFNKIYEAIQWIKTLWCRYIVKYNTNFEDDFLLLRTRHGRNLYSYW